MSKSRRINLKLNYIGQFALASVWESTIRYVRFVLYDSLETTRYVMHHVFAVISCYLLCPYAYIAITNTLALVGCLSAIFVFQYCSQILNWFEILAVIGPIQRFDILCLKEITH